MPATVRFASRGLLRRPVQTALLTFALTISLSATLTLMAVLAGVEHQIRDDLSKVGTDVVNINISPNIRNMLKSPLSLQDCVWMQEITDGVVAPFEISFGMIEDEGLDSPLHATVIETTPAWDNIVPLERVEGRFFHGGEKDVCVLDSWVKEKLFGERTSLGEVIEVQSFTSTRRLTVVGVLKDPLGIRDRFEEFDFTSGARSRMLRTMEFRGLYVPKTYASPDVPIHGAVIKIPEGTEPFSFEPALIERLGTDRQSQVWVWSRKSWIESVLSATHLLTQVGDIVWVIVLVVTGIMIATVTLVAVRQRFREIAIRRTEGARKGDIISQLLLENALLSGVSGLFALLLSSVGGRLLEARYLSWTPTFLLQDIVLALGLGISLGVLATVVPAYRASSLDPVEVLCRP